MLFMRARRGEIEKYVNSKNVQNINDKWNETVRERNNDKYKKEAKSKLTEVER